MCVLIQSDFCMDDSDFSLLSCVSTQGEPGYVIASPGANFVPGRKGEQGPPVSLKKI